MTEPREPRLEELDDEQMGEVWRLEAAAEALSRVEARCREAVRLSLGVGPDFISAREILALIGGVS